MVGGGGVEEVGWWAKQVKCSLAPFSKESQEA